MMTSAASANKVEEKTTVQMQMKDKDVQVKKSASAFMFLTPEVASYFVGEHGDVTLDLAVTGLIFPGLAGGCAGAASRTVVSPLERLKIIQYVVVKIVRFSVWLM